MLDLSISKSDLLALYENALIDMTNNGMEIERISQSKNMLACYLRMFHMVPHFVSTDYDDAYFVREESTDLEDIDSYKTMKAIADKYKDQCVVIRNFDVRVIILPYLILSCDEDSLYGCYNEEQLPQELLDCVVKASKEDTKYMSYVTSGSSGFNTMDMEVHKTECDLTTNYNDDLPIQQLTDFINGPESGLVILHGVPGTGKTHLLRHLIYSTDKEFMFLDSSCFNCITDSSFIKLLIQNKDAVVVLEDSEVLLRDRMGGNNASLSALLNLSDGILGDSLNLKFICTFNADLKNIDDAVKRKGRLKVKYELKALTSDKVQALASKLGKEIPQGKSLPLCEVYSYGEENGAEIKNKKPIGFN